MEDFALTELAERLEDCLNTLDFIEDWDGETGTFVGIGKRTPNILDGLDPEMVGKIKEAVRRSACESSTKLFCEIRNRYNEAMLKANQETA